MIESQAGGLNEDVNLQQLEHPCGLWESFRCHSLRTYSFVLPPQTETIGHLALKTLGKKRWRRTESNPEIPGDHISAYTYAEKPGQMRMSSTGTISETSLSLDLYAIFLLYAKPPTVFTNAPSAVLSTQANNTSKPSIRGVFLVSRRKSTQ